MFDFNPSPMEMMAIGTIALLLFGERLPEMARKYGRHFINFKRGVQGIKDELTGAINATASPSAPSATDEFDEEEPTAPKFEPPPRPKPRTAVAGEASEAAGRQVCS